MTACCAGGSNVPGICVIMQANAVGMLRQRSDRRVHQFSVGVEEDCALHLLCQSRPTEIKLLLSSTNLRAHLFDGDALAVLQRSYQQHVYRRRWARRGPTTEPDTHDRGHSSCMRPCQPRAKRAGRRTALGQKHARERDGLGTPRDRPSMCAPFPNGQAPEPARAYRHPIRGADSRHGVTGAPDEASDQQNFRGAGPRNSKSRCGPPPPRPLPAARARHAACRSARCTADAARGRLDREYAPPFLPFASLSSACTIGWGTLIREIVPSSCPVFVHVAPPPVVPLVPLRERAPGIARI